MEAPESARLFEAAKATALGSRRNNQDRGLFLSYNETMMLGLADGLGGHPRGEVAAQLFVDVCEAQFRQAQKPLADPVNFMLQCIGKAHAAIQQFGQRQTPPIAPRTTAVLAVIQGGIAYWSHVGDSRLYLIRGHQVRAQTRDHSQVRLLRGAGRAPRPHASLTRCLGGATYPPTTTCGPATLLHHGDVVVLCSDGLWGQVSQHAMVDALGNPEVPLDEGLRTLVGDASTAKGSDNVTAVALRWLAPTSATADAALLEPPPDPVVDKAIRHLHNMLKKISPKD